MEKYLVVLDDGKESQHLINVGVFVANDHENAKQLAALLWIESMRNQKCYRLFSEKLSELPLNWSYYDQ